MKSLKALMIISLILLTQIIFINIKEAKANPDFVLETGQYGVPCLAWKGIVSASISDSGTSWTHYSEIHNTTNYYVKLFEGTYYSAYGIGIEDPGKMCLIYSIDGEGCVEVSYFYDLGGLTTGSMYINGEKIFASTGGSCTTELSVTRSFVNTLNITIVMSGSGDNFVCITSVKITFKYETYLPVYIRCEEEVTYYNCTYDDSVQKYFSDESFINCSIQVPGDMVYQSGLNYDSASKLFTAKPAWAYFYSYTKVLDDFTYSVNYNESLINPQYVRPNSILYIRENVNHVALAYYDGSYHLEKGLIVYLDFRTRTIRDFTGFNNFTCSKDNIIVWVYEGGWSARFLDYI